jgi:predicted kinase
MPQKLIMMVGCPGSGKSSAAAEISKNLGKTIVISSDEIRGEIHGDESVQSNPGYVFYIFYNRVKEALRQGYSVVMDATNVKRKDRKHALASVDLAEDGIVPEKICVVIDTPLYLCLEQNEMRERHVPDDVIIRMHNSIMDAPPAEDEGSAKDVWASDGDISKMI